MNKFDYTPKGSSRQEATARTNQMKATLNLAAHPDFGQGSDCYTYNYLGYEVRLRFSYEWMAKCPQLGIETSFPHQPPEQIRQILSNWLTAHIEQPQAPAAQLRQATPAVLCLAEYHDIPIPLADEIMRGR